MVVELNYFQKDASWTHSDQSLWPFHFVRANRGFKTGQLKWGWNSEGYRVVMYCFRIHCKTHYVNSSPLVKLEIGYCGYNLWDISYPQKHKGLLLKRISITMLSLSNLRKEERVFCIYLKFNMVGWNMLYKRFEGRIRGLNYINLRGS